MENPNSYTGQYLKEYLRYNHRIEALNRRA
jgi:hypothetical protein